MILPFVLSTLAAASIDKQRMNGRCNLVRSWWALRPPQADQDMLAEPLLEIVSRDDHTSPGLSGFQNLDYLLGKDHFFGAFQAGVRW